MKIVINKVVFDRHEMRYTGQVTLDGKKLISTDPEWEEPADKAVRETLSEMIGDKGVVTHASPVPYLYYIPRTKFNRITGSGVDHAVDAIVDKQYTSANVLFTVTLDSDAADVEGVSNTFSVYIPFEWVLPKDDDLEAKKAAVEQMLFTGQQFTYEEDKWVERILKAIYRRCAETKEELAEANTLKNKLAESAGMYGDYVQDLAGVLTPDIPRDVFTKFWDDSSRKNIITQALSAVSNKVAGLVVASEKKDEQPVTAGGVKEAFEQANAATVDLEHALATMNPRFSFQREHATLVGTLRSGYLLSTAMAAIKRNK